MLIRRHSAIRTGTWPPWAVWGKHVRVLRCDQNGKKRLSIYDLEPALYYTPLDFNKNVICYRLQDALNFLTHCKRIQSAVLKGGLTKEKPLIIEYYHLYNPEHPKLYLQEYFLACSTDCSLLSHNPTLQDRTQFKLL